MSWLMRVIGRVLGTTQTVTLAYPTQDGLTGGNNNIAEQPKPVSKESKRKRSPARQASQDQSPKAETSCVRTRTKKSLTTGTRQAPPAPPFAKSKQKSKPKAAPKATKAVSSAKGKKSVRKTSGQAGK